MRVYVDWRSFKLSLTRVSETTFKSCFLVLPKAGWSKGGSSSTVDSLGSSQSHLRTKESNFSHVNKVNNTTRTRKSVKVQLQKTICRTLKVLFHDTSLPLAVTGSQSPPLHHPSPPLQCLPQGMDLVGGLPGRKRKPASPRSLVKT